MFRAAAQIDSPPTGADLRPRSSKIFGFVAVHVQGIGQGGVKPPHSPSQAVDEAFIVSLFSAGGRFSQRSSWGSPTARSLRTGTGWESFLAVCPISFSLRRR